ncbi:0a0ea045-a5b6-47b8-baeb-9413dc6c4f26 [Thermothielavioides terrestris]|uniref:0a0ea045-a5b6-47b8-baeb-9413dc6c4f26 n=1 Tax=Thermothielavioides terrestris TaxID=2587410 RepID=A0A3S4D6M8_9PEZI|nr:0a0ea045-a5b6-47b8-baeb-9413dc6c4f26 [Thermothielavioides terrestris]
MDDKETVPFYEHLLPLIDLLAERYDVSPQAINLTITLFFVFQGIAPSFWSPLSDSFGRRPVYLATFTIYTAASLGLSISDRNYPALLLLRAMQSIGGSAVLSLAYAVVADVTVHSERGEDEAVTEGDINTGKTGRGKFVIPNPFPSLRIVFYPDTFLVLWLAGCPYALWFCVQTLITPVFSQTYRFNPLEVGSCFLAGGAGIIAGGFVASQLMDRNYKHVAQQAGFTIDRNRGDDVASFLIEHARSRCF